MCFNKVHFFSIAKKSVKFKGYRVIQATGLRRLDKQSLLVKHWYLGGWAKAGHDGTGTGYDDTFAYTFSTLTFTHSIQYAPRMTVCQAPNFHGLCTFKLRDDRHGWRINLIRLEF